MVLRRWRKRIRWKFGCFRSSLACTLLAKGSILQLQWFCCRRKELSQRTRNTDGTHPSRSILYTVQWALILVWHNNRQGSERADRSLDQRKVEAFLRPVMHLHVLSTKVTMPKSPRSCSLTHSLTHPIHVNLLTMPHTYAQWHKHCSRMHIDILQLHPTLPAIDSNGGYPKSKCACTYNADDASWFRRPEGSCKLSLTTARQGVPRQEEIGIYYLSAHLNKIESNNIDMVMS